MLDGRPFAVPEWFRALTLEERAVSLRRETGGDSGPPVDVERAESRERRWRSQAPFAEEGLFAGRLAAAGLSEATFHHLLGEPVEELARRAGGAPDWLASLEDAFRVEPADPFSMPPLREGARAHQAFFEVVRPLLDAAASRLRRESRKLHGGLLFDPSTVAELFAGSLSSRLILLLGRVMVLELSLAGREGRLAGETPEARFQSFAASLLDRETALGILRQYPVLARQIVETLDRWVEASLDFLRHLMDDAPALRAAFFPDFDPGPLARIEGGLGDSHRGGRSVIIAEFASGLRLVYKPKSMGVERAFQNLLAWTGEKGFAPAYRPLRVMDGGDHGWVEMVEAGPCSSREELERFYRRQGGYLALLNLLSATDFHHENLIAAGEHPVLVDLEALFHPWADDLGRTPDERAALGRPVFETVLRTGLLPLRSREADHGHGGLDLSGLAAAAGQMTPQPALMNEKSGTDAMRYVRRSVEIPVGRHRPTLEGADVSLREFLGPLLDGFTDMSRLLAAHRDELAAPGGVLDAFAGTEVRVILRPTRTYAELLVEAQHPFVLGDALDRDRLLDRLWEVVAERPCLVGLVVAERRELLRGDIPLFTARPGSRDLWAGDGTRFPGFLPFSGLEAVRERLARLGEEELARQTWIIRDSIEALALKGQDLPPYRLDPRAEEPSGEEILEVARAVGRRLEEMALRGEGEAHWLCVQSQGPGTPWALDVTGLDLHLGLPGIVLFLAYLGAVTGEERWTGLARDGAASLRWRAALQPRRLRSIGAYSGWGGSLYALTHLAALWNEPALLDDAEAVVSFLPELIEADEDLDLVGGAAGCILCLLRLWERRPSAATLAAAIRCGERLLERAVPAGPGIGWVLEVAGPRPLAGLSHGAAGIAWALLELATATGDERFRRAALEGLAYERSLYAPGERNWPDLRNSGENGEPFFMSAWCHGAPGIGLARLACLRHLDGPEVRGEIAAAVETTLVEGFGLSHCLCHGDLGNLEVLLLAREALGLDLSLQAAGILGGLLADARAHGWRFGLPGRTEPPGLMLGLAGIGYGLLRAAEPRVPSVLVLAPPRTGLSDSADLHPGWSRPGASERSKEDGEEDRHRPRAAGRGVLPQPHRGGEGEPRRPSVGPDRAAAD